LILAVYNLVNHWAHRIQYVLYCIYHFYGASHMQHEPFRTATDHSDWHSVGVYSPKRYRQLQVKDLPRVLTWHLERDMTI